MPTSDHPPAACRIATFLRPRIRTLNQDFPLLLLIVIVIVISFRRLGLGLGLGSGSGSRARLPALAGSWRVFLRCVVLAAGLIAPSAHGAGLGPAFDDANRLYEEGQYAEAIAAYSQIVQGGRVSAALYFNLGNAHFKAGQMGRAIVNYRLAERLAPRDPDIRSNLLTARTTVLGGAPPPAPLWRRVVSRLSLDEWTVLAAAALWVLAVTLALGQWRPALRPTLRRFTLLAGLALFMAVSGMLVSWRERCLKPEVIVIQRDAILHHGPLDESPRLQSLRDGQELAVLDTKNDWLQVAGAARGIGWIRRDQVATLNRYGGSVR